MTTHDRRQLNEIIRSTLERELMSKARGPYEYGYGQGLSGGRRHRVRRGGAYSGGAKGLRECEDVGWYSHGRKYGGPGKGRVKRCAKFGKKKKRGCKTGNRWIQALCRGRRDFPGRTIQQYAKMYHRGEL